MEMCKTGTKRPHGPTRDRWHPHLGFSKDDFVRLVTTGLSTVIVFPQYGLVLASPFHFTTSCLACRLVGVSIVL